MAVKQQKEFRLLGIDPSPSLRAVLERLGEESGFVVTVSSDLATARECLDTEKFDLVVTAAELPDGAYPDVLAAVRVREDMRDVPVILLMAARRDNIVHEALDKGMTEVFFKRDLADFARYLERFATAVPERLPGNDGPRALVVEDDRALAAYYKKLLVGRGFVVEDVPSGEAALWEAERRRYEFILVDLVLGGSCSGMQFLRRLRASAYPSSQAVAIAVSAYEDEARRLEALRAGANGFILKPIKEAELFALMQGLMQRAATEETRVAAESEAKAACQRCQPCQLTPRESHICALVAAGYSDKRIAEEMGISYWTVRTHIAHAFKKCDVSNRVELVRRLQGV